MKINDLFHRKNFNLFFKEYLDSYTKKDKRVIKQAYSKYMEFLDTLPIKKRPSAPTPSIVKGFVEHLNSTCRGSGGASTYSRFKKVVIQAVREGILKKNPCAEIKCHCSGDELVKDILSGTLSFSEQ